MKSSTSGIRVVAFVAGGPMAEHALRALHLHHRVVAIARLAGARGVIGTIRAAAKGAAIRAGVVQRDPISAWAKAEGVPIVTLADGEDPVAAARIADLAPDFGCIATFPTRIGPSLLHAAGAATVNMHPSLLPRHRGSDPIFWTYHAGDRESGVSTHLATDRLDAGPVVGRSTTPILRGEPAVDVHGRLAALGGALLARSVDALASGTALHEEQDEAAATTAPRVRPGHRYCPLEAWGAERSWHFLAGLAGRHREPLRDTTGRPVPYTLVEGYEVCDGTHPPGAVVPVGSGWDVWATDGRVRIYAGR